MTTPWRVLLVLLALAALPVLGIGVFGWNWARGPLQELVLKKTGRELRIEGDLELALGWPAPRVHARGVSFANPAWATAPQLVSADAVDLGIDLPELLRGRLAFPEVRLTRPRVFLEQASGGRKTWLLDLAQIDEDARVPIGRLLLDRGELAYTDAAQRTELRVSLSTVDAPAAAAAAKTPAAADPYSLGFTVTGRFHGLAAAAEGQGGAVLALRDETLPYALRVQATLGSNHLRAEGRITSLIRLVAVDLQLTLSGDSLAAWFPVIGIALPPTPAYRASGHLLRQGTIWRYERFAGRVGGSDIAGNLQLDTAGQRPLLSGTVASKRLDLSDLGPAIGARQTASTTSPKPARVLPDLPFDTMRWHSLDADVNLQADSLLHDRALPLDRLQMRLRLKDSLLTLDPLEFGVAGGRMKGQLTLDGRAEPLRGQVRVLLRGLQLGRLLPSVDLSKTSIGQLAGDIELSGRGASVGRMLATADGRVSLVAQNGQVSRLLMEQIGLHLLEIVRLNLTGDQTVPLRCLVADFGVTGGVMRARALVLDTAVNTVEGSGVIDLGHETLDLAFVPRTRISSVVALRSPIYIKGSFAEPLVQLDAGRLAVRGLGALALGMVNPLLALIPLFEAGPGEDSECASLLRESRVAAPEAGR